MTFITPRTGFLRTLSSALAGALAASLTAAAAIGLSAPPHTSSTIGVRRLDTFAVLGDTLVNRPESGSEYVLVTHSHILVVHHSGFSPASPHHDSSAHRLDAVHYAHAAALPAELRLWRRHAHDNHHYDPDPHNRTPAAVPAQLRDRRRHAHHYRAPTTTTTTTITATTTTPTTSTETSTSTTTTAPDPCKNGGWMDLGYANQGKCESPTPMTAAREAASPPPSAPRRRPHVLPAAAPCARKQRHSLTPQADFLDRRGSVSGPPRRELQPAGMLGGWDAGRVVCHESSGRPRLRLSHATQGYRPRRSRLMVTAWSQSALTMSEPLVFTAPRTRQRVTRSCAWTVASARSPVPPPRDWGPASGARAACDTAGAERRASPCRLP